MDENENKSGWNIIMLAFTACAMCVCVCMKKSCSQIYSSSLVHKVNFVLYYVIYNRAQSIMHTWIHVMRIFCFYSVSLLLTFS